LTRTVERGARGGGLFAGFGVFGGEIDVRARGVYLIIYLSEFYNHIHKYICASMNL